MQGDVDGRAAPLRARARPAAGHRLTRPRRQRRPAVALPRDRFLAGDLRQRGGVRLGPGRLADLAAHAVRGPALGAEPGRRARRGGAGRAAHDLAGPRSTRRSATSWRRCAGRSRPWSRATSTSRPRVLETLLPRTAVLGGSAAQREVLEDTLVFALARSGQGDRAAALLDRATRPAPLTAGRPASRRRQSGARRPPPPLRDG